MSGAVTGLRRRAAVRVGVIGSETGEFVVPLGALLTQIGQASQGRGAFAGVRHRPSFVI
ncbi:hypothetical protein [Streptomyces sp. NPDC094468]|uniref:hypothetical protein n=1 Tax=Streptomyces sp. NPDC094468 TaxID=3366066 RepID=UPI00382E2DC6